MYTDPVVEEREKTREELQREIWSLIRQMFVLYRENEELRQIIAELRARKGD